MHRYLLHNGEIHTTSEPLLSPGQVGFLNGWGVFSTLRVTAGVLFAFERHYARMKKDAALLHVPFEFSPTDLQARLLKLVEANNAFDATLRVALVRNRGGLFEGTGIGRDADLVAFTADLSEWGEGVRLTYVPHGRYGASVFSGAKVTSWVQNLTWNEEAHLKGFDEVILLNEAGQISECTSANIFAVDGTNVWTPPLSHSGCLPGITRAILLEEIRLPGLQIAEKELMPSDLENADQAFITSTTRDLIPILAIDGTPLNQKQELMLRLQRAFLDYRGRYVESRAHRKETIVQ